MDDMRYEKITIETTEEAEDILAAELAGLGIEGVEFEDSLQPEDEGLPVYVADIPAKIDIPAGKARLSFYLDASADNTELLSKVEAMLAELSGFTDIGSGTMTRELTEDQDWLNSWKDYFHQFAIELEDGSKALFLPSWEEAEDRGKHDFLVRIDPGTAFGTGAHESTRLAILLLKRTLKNGDSVLDLGTGSGILSILSVLFGAGKVTAIDIDPNAAPAVEQNLRDNGMDEKDVLYIEGNVLEDEKLRKDLENTADVVAANILPNVLLPLTPLVPSFLKPGGRYILSGILNEKEEEVKKALEKSGFTDIEALHDGEWTGLICTHSLQTRP